MESLSSGEIEYLVKKGIPEDKIETPVFRNSYLMPYSAFKDTGMTPSDLSAIFANYFTQKLSAKRIKLMKMNHFLPIKTNI